MNFDECIKKGNIVKIKPDKELAILELKEAKYDLNSAKEDFEKEDWKWATDKAYYSMFHAARALLICKGYKEIKSHVCVIEGIRELFVKTGELDIKFLDYIEQGKKRREDAIYESNYSQHIAETYIEVAEDFIKEVKRLINRACT
ncbi:MAG: HEPN domain-containing protein [Nanoarchaeota archaeon]|nr:HEPN domain-containing protein [Nanoarchaeota archaeon]